MEFVFYVVDLLCISPCLQNYLTVFDCNATTSPCTVNRNPNFVASICYTTYYMIGAALVSYVGNKEIWIEIEIENEQGLTSD